MKNGRLDGRLGDRWWEEIILVDGYHGGMRKGAFWRKMRLFEVFTLVLVLGLL